MEDPSESSGVNSISNSNHRDGGWFPTACCSFDVVRANFEFDVAPEPTRHYISFKAGQRVLVQMRQACGWWIGIRYVQLLLAWTW